MNNLEEKKKIIGSKYNNNKSNPNKTNPNKTHSTDERNALLATTSTSSSLFDSSTSPLPLSTPHQFDDVNGSVNGNIGLNNVITTNSSLFHSLGSSSNNSLQTSQSSNNYNIWSSNSTSNSHSKTLPVDWEMDQDYRYQNYYIHRPNSLTTWEHPISHQQHPNNSWFKDSYDLPDYDLVQLQHIHRYYYQATKSNQSSYFPYYTNLASPPNVSQGSKQHPKYWNNRVQQCEKLLTRDDNIVLNAIINDIKSGPYSTKHVIQPNKYDTPMSCYQICCGTFIRNGLISLFSLILWLSCIALLLGWLLYYRHQSWDPTNGNSSGVGMVMMLLGLNTQYNHIGYDNNIITTMKNNVNTTQPSLNNKHSSILTMFKASTFDTTQDELLKEDKEEGIDPDISSQNPNSPKLTKKDSPMLGFGLCLISAVLVYSIYILSWVWPGMCGWMCCGGPVSGRFGTQDKMMESLKQSNPLPDQHIHDNNHNNNTDSTNNNNNQNTQFFDKNYQKYQKINPKHEKYVHHSLDDIKTRLKSLEKSTPRLWLQVECSHQRLTNRTMAHQRGCWENITTLCGFFQGKYSTKTTFIAHQNVPIIYSLDVSPSPKSVINTIHRAKERIAQRSCVPFNFSIDIHTLFQLHPAQHRYLELLRQRLYHTHSFRDTDTRVLVKYQVGGGDLNQCGIGDNNNGDQIIDLTYLFSNPQQQQKNQQHQQDQQITPISSHPPSPSSSSSSSPQYSHFQTHSSITSSSPSSSPSQYTMSLTQTFPFMATEDDPMVPSVRVLPKPLQSFKIAQFDQEIDLDDDNNDDIEANNASDVHHDGSNVKKGTSRCCSNLSRIFLFSPLSFLWFHLCLYLPLLMLFRAGTRELPYVNIKYLVIGPKKGIKISDEQMNNSFASTNTINDQSIMNQEQIKEQQHNDLKNGFVDHIVLNKPRAIWKWNWADELRVE